MSSSKYDKKPFLFQPWQEYLIRLMMVSAKQHVNELNRTVRDGLFCLMV